MELPATYSKTPKSGCRNVRASKGTSRSTQVTIARSSHTSLAEISRKRVRTIRRFDRRMSDKASNSLAAAKRHEAIIDILKLLKPEFKNTHRLQRYAKYIDKLYEGHPLIKEDLDQLQRHLQDSLQDRSMKINLARDPSISRAKATLQPITTSEDTIYSLKQICNLKSRQYRVRRKKLQSQLSLLPAYRVSGMPKISRSKADSIIYARTKRMSRFRTEAVD